LGLDNERSWIKTHEANVLTWPKDRLPVGLTRAKAGQWKFGELPTQLEKQVFDDVQRQRRTQTLKQIERDEKPPTPPLKPSGERPNSQLKKPKPEQKQSQPKKKKPRPSATKPRPSAEKPRPGQSRRKRRDLDM